MKLILIALLLTAAFARGADPSSNDGIVSHIKREPVESSALASVGYSRHLHALEIEFRNGAIYRYLEVPASLHRDLMSAASKARFYDQNIRRRFHSVHVRPPQA